MTGVFRTEQDTGHSCSGVGTWAWRLRFGMISVRGWLPPSLVYFSMHAVPAKLVPAHSRSRLHLHHHHRHLQCRLCLHLPGRSLVHTCNYPDGCVWGETVQNHILSICFLSTSISDLKTELACLAWLVTILFAPHERQLL